MRSRLHFDRRRPDLRRTLAVVSIVGSSLVGGIGGACVPATDETNPHGAVGIVTEPSPGTKGEPFITTDGWTVFVETLIVRATIAASTDNVLSDAVHGDDIQLFPTVLFRASEPMEAHVRALSIGPGHVTLRLSGIFSIDSPDDAEHRNNIDPNLSARFQRLPDSSSSMHDGFDVGPDFLLIARGVKAGRVVRLDLTFQSLFHSNLSEDEEPDPLAHSSSEVEQPIEVMANALVTARVRIVAENLFLRRSVGLVFDDLARADTDGDGNLSIEELAAATPPPVGPVPVGVDPKKAEPTMLDVLATRGNRLFVAP